MDKSDRELLEFAALAIGASYDFNHKWINYHNSFAYEAWEPLIDDGDAFRLAVKLRFILLLEIPRIGIGPSINGPEIYLEEGDDECAAVRRAIVRAAAEIGKRMQEQKQ